MQKFNPREVLEIAINMEVQGEAFYKQLMESAQDENVRNMLKLLAQDESCHAEDFRELISTLIAESEEYEYDLDEASALYFEAFAKTQIFKDIEAAKKTAAGFKEIYEAVSFAIGLEIKTIGFYREIYEIIGNAPGAEKIKAIIAQEQTHVQRLYSLLECKIE